MIPLLAKSFTEKNPLDLMVGTSLGESNALLGELNVFGKTNAPVRGVAFFDFGELISISISFRVLFYIFLDNNIIYFKVVVYFRIRYRDDAKPLE